MLNAKKEAARINRENFRKFGKLLSEFEDVAILIKTASAWPIETKVIYLLVQGYLNWGMKNNFLTNQ